MRQSCQGWPLQGVEWKEAQRSTEAKRGEGKIQRKGTAGAKALRQGCALEQLKGSAAGESEGREKEVDKTTFCMV